MMSRDPGDFTETHPHLAEFNDFLDDFNRETERGAALAAAAMIDDLLLRVLQAFLIENSGAKSLLTTPNAPLGTFAAKIAATSALGLISDAEGRECGLIRKIRNEFAHKVRISFSSEAVAKLCSKLAYSAKSYGDVTVNSRGQFTTSAVAMILNLTNRPHYVRQRRIKPHEWPY